MGNNQRLNKYAETLIKRCFHLAKFPNRQHQIFHNRNKPGFLPHRSRDSEQEATRGRFLFWKLKQLRRTLRHDPVANANLGLGCAVGKHTQKNHNQEPTNNMVIHAFTSWSLVGRSAMQAQKFCLGTLIKPSPVH